jgi:peptidoglycan hydrolase-like protein with peptidoglycan-binding domain
MTMGGLLVMPAVGSCVPLAALPAVGGGPIAIQQPVGQGPLARNRPDDVRTIQEALNQVTVKGAAGGPMPFLDVDGIMGPKTLAAIVNFQRAQVQGIRPDGLVEPGKQTILRLNAIVAPVSKFDLNARLASALPLVRAALAAAVANLTAVITAGPGAGGQATTAADRLNRHFRIDTLDAARQSEARVTLFETYSEMALVVNQPELFDMFGAIDAFDVDPNNAKIALTTVQGVFEPAIVNGNDNPARHIRLGLGFFAPNVTPEFAAFILLHELAHFTSRRDGQIIDDNGRGWFDDTFIRPLGAPQRLLNADSYAGFAHECRTNSATRPPFVRTAPGGLRGAR